MRAAHNWRPKMDPENSPIEEAQLEVEEAKKELEEATETLENELDKKRDTDIQEAVESAHQAIDIAINHSTIQENAIDDIKEKLTNHEESDEWLKNQVRELSTRTECLERELSNLRALQIQATELEAEPMEIPVETILPETATETSLETPTEALERKEDVNPVQQEINQKHQKPLMI